VPAGLAGRRIHLFLENVAAASSRSSLSTISSISEEVGCCDLLDRAISGFEYSAAAPSKNPHRSERAEKVWSSQAGQIQTILTLSRGVVAEF
jgi:hypothetical protein